MVKSRDFFVQSTLFLYLWKRRQYNFIHVRCVKYINDLTVCTIFFTVQSMNIMLNEIIAGNTNVLVLIANLLCEFNGNY